MAYPEGRLVTMDEMKVGVPEPSRDEATMSQSIITLGKNISEIKNMVGDVYGVLFGSQADSAAVEDTAGMHGYIRTLSNETDDIRGVLFQIIKRLK